MGESAFVLQAVIKRIMCLNFQSYSNMLMGLDSKVMSQSYLKNTVFTFKEQQQDTSIIIQLLSKALTKS